MSEMFKINMSKEFTMQLFFLSKNGWKQSYFIYIYIPTVPFLPESCHFLSYKVAKKSKRSVFLGEKVWKKRKNKFGRHKDPKIWLVLWPSSNGKTAFERLFS